MSVCCLYLTLCALSAAVGCLVGLAVANRILEALDADQLRQFGQIDNVAGKNRREHIESFALMVEGCMIEPSVPSVRGLNLNAQN